MRAAIYNGPNRPISVENLPDPQPGPGELLVRVHRCGICGSDVAMTGAGPLYLPHGRFGHEWAGEVVEAGRDTSLPSGARIAGLPVAPCGACDGCATGNPLFCEVNGFLVGGFGEFMVVPEAAAICLPGSLSFADGALVEPMSCGLHALNFARMEPGSRVLVIGAGAMALSAIFWARRLGAGKIGVMSRSAHREESVMAMGADAMFGFDPDDQARIATVLDGAPEVVVECVGKPGMLELASQVVRARGTILSLGMCQHGDPVVPALMTHKEVRLLFPRGYTVAEFESTARALDRVDVDPAVMVSKVIGLDDLPDAMGQLRSGSRGSGKIHVDPWL